MSSYFIDPITGAKYTVMEAPKDDPTNVRPSKVHTIEVVAPDGTLITELWRVTKEEESDV